MTSQRALNMRVTANSSQGHRKYMEDCYKIRFQRDTTAVSQPNATNVGGDLDPNNNQQSDILFSYFGIFDGHGGAQASQYCKQHLYWSIIRQEGFWARDDDAAVLEAIRKGFMQCHDDMWSELPSWPRTASGLPSTSGTTATVVFIKGSRVYVGHVGDSGLAVGMRSRRGGGETWEGRKMTRDHKPEDPIELKRILGVGGDVQLKSGVNRVVWNRPVFNRFQSRNFKVKCPNF
jgi:protein phosphatase 1D